MSSIDPQFAYDLTDRYAPYLNPLPEVNSFREFARFVPNAQRSGRQFRGPLQSAISHGQTIDTTGTVPEVESAVVRMRVRADRVAHDPAPLQAVLAVAFTQRRKMIRTTLRPWLDGRAAPCEAAA